MALSRESAAIVIESRDHGESDKIITFLTPGSGKISGIAKGANRSKKRFLNKLELFSHVTIAYTEKKRGGLVFIEDAELCNSYIRLRLDLERYTAASFIREILLLAVTEHQEDMKLFQLVCNAFTLLDEGKHPLGGIAVFLVRFFDVLGYRPDLSHCSKCGKGFTIDKTFQFHHASAGLRCERCTVKSNDSCSELSAGTIRFLNAALTVPLEKVNRLQFSQLALRQSLFMLHKYGRNLFQREINSWKSLKLLVK